MFIYYGTLSQIHVQLVLLGALCSELWNEVTKTHTPLVQLNHIA